MAQISLPFCVSSLVVSPRLFELSDGRFQLVERGAVAPFVAGHRHALVERALADFLRQLQVPRVQLTPAVIWDPATRVEHRTHERLMIGQFFSSDQINDLDLEGDRLLTLGDEYVFASPSLKERLEAAGFECLHFSPGLTEFAASAT